MIPVPRNKFQDFIDDPSFVDWLKDPAAENNKYWEEYISQHPEEKASFEQAKYILSKFLKEKNNPGEEDIRSVWLNIRERIQHPPRKIRYINFWSIAASLLLTVGIGTGI